MLNNVSLEQMEAFADLGYIVLPQVLPRASIEVAKNAIEDQAANAQWQSAVPWFSRSEIEPS